MRSYRRAILTCLFSPYLPLRGFDRLASTILTATHLYPLLLKTSYPPDFIQRRSARTVPNLGNPFLIQLLPPLASHELLYQRRCNAVVGGVTSYGVYRKTWTM